MSLDDKYMEQARENGAIRYNGLDFYPLTVRQYALFRMARPSMELMQSSLPPELARLSWCCCLDELDKKAERETGKSPGFLAGIMILTATALRLDWQNDPMSISLARSGDKLKAIVVKRAEDAVPTVLSTKQMSEVRRLLAAQNGYEIPDENWNPELVRAQQYISSQKTGEIVFNLETLVYSVAANMRCRAAEIWGWPIREFRMMQEGIERSLNYQIFTAAELSGRVKFKNGNPYPTWKLDRKASLPGGFRTMDELSAGAHGLLQDNT